VAEALALAGRIAACSPHAVRAAKRLADAAPRLALDEALRLETDLQLGLLGSPNQTEAVQATVSKRAAEFEDP